MRGAALLTAALLLGAAPLHASSGGITGRSGRGNASCNDCHGGGMRPEVAFIAPPTVEPGATVVLRFTVRAASPLGEAAGFNVAAEAGTLAVIAGQGARRAAGELTHTEPKDSEGNRTAAWEFEWTAPAVPGTYRLWGAGNSVNGNGQSSGDRANTTVLRLDVVAAPPSETPTPTATPEPPTATASPSPSPTATGDPPACAGDCDGDGAVAIDELVTAVGIALASQPLAACPSVDQDADGGVAINELIAAVTRALDGC